jgi:addiction module RelB/DinJ family antitoxin
MNLRIEPEIKADAEALFGSFGLTVTDAVNVFLRQSIARGGFPFAVAVANVQTKKAPKPGCLKGKIWMADDFDEPLEDFKEYME